MVCQLYDELLKIEMVVIKAISTNWWFPPEGLMRILLLLYILNCGIFILWSIVVLLCGPTWDSMLTNDTHTARLEEKTSTITHLFFPETISNVLSVAGLNSCFPCITSKTEVSYYLTFCRLLTIFYIKFGWN